MKTLAVICAGLGAQLYGDSARADFWKNLSMTEIASPFPALTCPAQAMFRTGLEVCGHGMGASGFFDRRLRKAFFWEQSSRLFEGKRIWENFRAHGGKVGQICLQQCPGPDSDFYLSPAPIHRHHGGMIQDFLSEPGDLYRSLCQKIGKKFNLMDYWGPFTSINASKWIAAAAGAMMRDLSDQKENIFLCAYLPALDYDSQKYGPDSQRARDGFTAFESVLGSLAAAARDAHFELIVTGDYAITQADTPLYPNRLLAENNYLRLREVRGMLYPNFHSSTAFALVDHQLCHIFADRTEDVPHLAALFEKMPGVARVMRREKTASLNHPNCGELILEAAEHAWFAYPWWTDRRQTPDYATHVDIHNKPGFDPLEQFCTFWPPLGTAQDASLIRGSHGKASRIVCGSTCDLGKYTSFLEMTQAVGSLLDA